MEQQLEIEFSEEAWDAIKDLAENEEIPTKMYHGMKQDGKRTVPLHSVVKFANWKCHKGDERHLNRLMKNADIILPSPKEFARNPELEKRCELLKAKQLNQQYNNMVASLVRPTPKGTNYSAITSGLNFSITVFATVFACIFLLQNLVSSVLIRCAIGLVFGIILLCIEVVLALRAVTKEDNESLKKR